MTNPNAAKLLADAAKLNSKIVQTNSIIDDPTTKAEIKADFAEQELTAG